MPSSHLILCHPLFLLPPIPPSIRVFSSESTLRMRWPKDWTFSFSIIPSKEIPGLISFRMDWLDLLAVQGTLESLLQHHSSKVSILRCSAFFTVHLSHPCMTPGKTIALTRWTLVIHKEITLFWILSFLIEVEFVLWNWTMGLDIFSASSFFFLKKFKYFALWFPFFFKVEEWFHVYLRANITLVILERYGDLGLSISSLSFAR